MENPTLSDKLLKFYLTRIRGRQDFTYMTRYLKPENELLVVGSLTYNNNAYVMKPKIVIGSDRMELYEFFGRKTEVRSQMNRNWLKFAVACTAVHFLIVRVPNIFSKYFGDQVGGLSKQLGA
jgi:hypothetical protein